MFNQYSMAPPGFGLETNYTPPQQVYQGFCEASMQPYNAPQMPPYQQYLPEPPIGYCFQDSATVYGGYSQPFPSQPLVLQQQQPQYCPQIMCYANQLPQQYVQQFGQGPSLPPMQWHQPPVQVPNLTGNYQGSCQQYDPRATECRSSVVPSQTPSFPRSQSQSQLSPRSYDQHTTAFSSLFPAASTVQTNKVEDTSQVVEDQQCNNEVVERGEFTERRISAESKDQRVNEGVSVADQRLDTIGPPVAELQKSRISSDARVDSHPTERTKSPQNRDSGRFRNIYNGNRLPLSCMYCRKGGHSTVRCHLWNRRVCSICKDDNIAAHIEIHCSKFEVRKGFAEDAEKFFVAPEKPAFALGPSYRPALPPVEKQSTNKMSDSKASVAARSRG